MCRYHYLTCLLLFVLFAGLSCKGEERSSQNGKTSQSPGSAMALKGPVGATIPLEDLLRTQEAIIRVAKQARPAVVNITAFHLSRPISQLWLWKENSNLLRRFLNGIFHGFLRDRPEENGRQQSTGSGFIISRRGYILTNLHVVAGADEIRVRLMDEREFLGELIETDEKNDLAAVKIPSRSDLPVIPLGDSDQAEVGDRVLAIGNPLGLDQTVTAGVISAVGRSDLGLTSQESFIQTDAMMSFGNSGGPLLNLEGEVIGIDTAVVASGHGIGFAIPVNIARWMAGPLLADISSPPVWLGIMARTATPQEVQDAGRQTGDGGVWVESVIPEGPAKSAGLKPKDLIIKMGSDPVTDVWQLRQWLEDNRVKSHATIDLMRVKKEEHLTAVFAERPSKMEIEQIVESNSRNFP